MPKKNARLTGTPATSREIRSAVLRVCVCTAFVLPAAHSNAALLYWEGTGPDERWLNPANWIQAPPGGGIPLPGFVPGPTDSATIDTGNVSIDGAAQVGVLDFRASSNKLTIQSNGSLTTNGNSFMRGALDAFGTLQVASGSTLQLTFPAARFFAGSTLINNGTVRVGPGSVLSLLQDATGAATYQSNGGLLDIAGGNLVVQPTMTIASLKLSPDAVNFSAIGSIDVARTLTVGSLEWNHGNIGASAPDAAMIVTGTATIGNVPLFGSLTELGSTPALRYGLTLNLNGTTNWAFGSVPITIQGPETGPGGVTTSASRIIVGPGAVFNDLGQLTDQPNRRITGLGVFQVLGTYRKSGTGTTVVDATFLNQGTLAVDSGSLWLVGNTTHDKAAVSIAAGAMLRQANGLFQNTTSIDNSGKLVLDGQDSIDGTVTYRGRAGSSVELPGFAVTIDADMAGSSLLLQGSLGGKGVISATTLDWQSGNMGRTDAPGGSTTVLGSASVAAAFLNVQGGRTLRFQGPTTWAAGEAFLNIGAGSTVIVAAGATFDDRGPTFGNRMILPADTVSGTFVNEGTYLRSQGSGQTTISVDFTNRGVLNAQSGSLWLGNFKNSGSIQVADGASVVFGGNGSLQPGSVVANAGTIQVPGMLRVDADVSLGAVQLPIGSIFGSGNVHIGRLDWDGGSFGTGLIPDASSGSATIDGIATIGSGQQLIAGGYRVNIAGEATMNATDFIIGPASTLAIGAGATFKDQGFFTTDSTIRGFGGSTLINAGTYRKLGGTGTTTITANLQNTGTVSVEAGRLALNAGAEFSAGSLSVSQGASAALTSAHFASGTTVRNDGSLELMLSHFDAGMTFASGASSQIILIGDRVFFDADVSTPSLTLRGNLGLNGPISLLLGNGTVTTDALRWESGAWMGEPGNPGGRTVVNGEALLTGALIDNSQSRDFRLEGSRVLELNGHTVWQAGAANISVGGFNPISPPPRLIIGANGVFEDQGGFSTLITRQIYGAGTIENNGLFVRSSFSGDFTQINAPFINRGTTRVNNGELWFARRFDNPSSGILEVNPGAFVRVDDPANWDATTGTLSGGRYIVHNAGTLNMNLGSLPGQAFSVAAVRNNAASLTLDGAQAQFAAFVPFAGARTALEALEVNSGTLELLNGATLTTTTSLLNTGHLTIGENSALTVGGAFSEGAGARTDVLGTLNATSFSFAGGTVLAGDHSIGTGRFGAASASFSSAAMFDVDVDLASGAADLFDFDGSVQLGGVLQVAFDGAAPASGRYRILSAAGGLSGGFASIATSGLDRSLYRVGVDTVGGDVYLTLAPVPEPSTWALMIGGLGVLVAASRRRQART